MFAQSTSKVKGHLPLDKMGEGKGVSFQNE